VTVTLEEELIQLVRSIQQRKCESQHIELKKAADGTPKRLYNKYSSFSNQRVAGLFFFACMTPMIFQLAQFTTHKICKKLLSKLNKRYR